MRVLYLHQYFTTPDMGGGTRSYELARRFVAAGHTVNMITARRQGTRNRAWERTTEGGITVDWRWIPYSNTMGHSRRILAFLRYAASSTARAIRLGGDVVYASSTPLTVAIPGVVASLLRRIPLVFEVRDLWPEGPVAVGALRNPVLIWGGRILERIAYKRAAHVVALSPGMAESIAASGTPCNRISVVPNGCDIEFFASVNENSPELSAVVPDLAGRPVVLYAGALGAVNGVTYVADIAAEMLRCGNSTAFVVMGEGVEKPAIRRHAEELGVLNRNFFLLDARPKKDMPWVFASATLVISVVIDNEMMWKNSANKFFDGLAAGRPVVINHEGWQADLLRSAGAGLVVPPCDPVQAAAEIGAFLASSGMIRSASEAAARLARERFDRDGQAAKVWEIVEGAVKARRERRRIA
ncbi:MAG: glycosyltransferase family 4 protein [Actinobacteria bacterium]|nr:glycosyltransferase family 4 protein [Actinomycetota bacterium]